MKLLNANSELRALKTLCEGGDKLASRILNAVGLETFYFPPARDAWRRVQSLLKSQGEIPSWNDLCADLAIPEQHRTLLSKDTQKPLPASAKGKVDSMLKTLDRYRQLRALAAINERLVTALEDEAVDLEELMDEVSEDMVKARTKADAKSKIMHFGRGNNTTELMKGLLNGTNRPVIPTGFKAFDDENGGILRGSLFVVAANTGGGKSTMAINLANNMSEGGSDVCVVPLEMTEDQMAARLYGLRTEMDVGKISQHKLAGGEKKKIVTNYKEHVAGLKKSGTRLSLFAPEEDMSIEEILMMLKPYRYDVIVIDYISLLRGADDDDQAKKLGAIARYAKIFAKNNNCVVVLLAQLDDKTKNIRYARAIREHANNAWFWFAPEEQQEVSVLDIRQVKARNQKRFNFELLSHNATMLITDMDDEHRGQGDEKTKAKADEYVKDLEDDDEEEDEDDD